MRVSTTLRVYFKLSFLFFLAFLSNFSVWAKNGGDKIRVACVGNSITYGAGIGNRFQNAYPGILQQWLGTDYEVRNFGYSARTMLQKGDYPYMHEQMYKQAKAFLPNIVTIKLGTNDSKPKNWIYKNDFEKDLTTMVNEFQALSSKPEIFLCLPAPAPKEKWGINDSTISRYIIPIIKKVAKKKKLKVIDLYSALKPYHPQYFVDGVHPNPDGSAVIAKEIYKELTGNEAPKFDSKQAFPGKKSTWNGCSRYDFICAGRNATVVVPKKAAEGKPWIWRPAFFDAFPSVDKALLEKGFHIAYLDVTHFYGSPNGVHMGNEFYDVMTKIYHLSSKVVVEGFSRGGYYALNWAAANADKVSCLYIDAPVCDLTSWPGRKRADLWKDVLAEWNVKDEEVTSSFRGNALQLLPKLAKARIPIIAVCGDSDKVVPFEENFKPVREAYEAMGGVVELILKPGCDHHPHSLTDPEPVVDFILRYQQGYDKYQMINRRTDLTNAFLRFKNEKKGTVAFLGGSITEMRGWKDQICEDLKQRFPETDFNFIYAGIGSTGSTPHAFRMERDILEKGVPDLLFFEAAVNDDATAKPLDQVRAVEGIVRHMRAVNPKMDLVMLYFIYDPFIPLLNKGIQPDVIMNHERVANAYSISSINLAYEIANRMKAGEFNWDKFGGTHPLWFGHKFYAASIAKLFDETIHVMNKAEIKPHEMPEKTLESFAYDKGKLVSIKEATRLKGFSIVEDWMPSVCKKALLRPGFCHVPMLECLKGGSSFEFEFKGRAVGIFCVAGPKAGVLEYKIDGKPYKDLNMYTKNSKGLYIPGVYMFDAELEEGNHILTVRVKKGEKSECQIRDFVVNE